MSTNFFIVRHESSMGPEVSREHIGKRSGGWVFQFQGRNHYTFQRWVQRLTSMGVYETIIDEYGRTYTFANFFKVVWETRATEWARGSVEPFMMEVDEDPCHTVQHNEGFPFCQYEFG